MRYRVSLLLLLLCLVLPCHANIQTRHPGGGAWRGHHVAVCRGKMEQEKTGDIPRDRQQEPPSCRLGLVRLLLLAALTTGTQLDAWGRCAITPRLLLMVVDALLPLFTCPPPRARSSFSSGGREGGEAGQHYHTTTSCVTAVLPRAMRSLRMHIPASPYQSQVASSCSSLCL